MEEKLKKLQEIQVQKDKMDEKGRIVLNGYEFVVLPIFIGEEEQFWNEVTFKTLPNKNKDGEYTDKALSSHIISIFANEAFEKMERKCSVIKNKILMKIIRKFSKKHYYADKYAKPLVYWLQKKVLYKGKQVTLYALERKYKLSKADIGRLNILMHELSGF